MIKIVFKGGGVTEKDMSETIFHARKQISLWSNTNEDEVDFQTI